LPAVFEVRASIPDPAFGWLQSKDILYKWATTCVCKQSYVTVLKWNVKSPSKFI
jgi:hypothetical protein